MTKQYDRTMSPRGSLLAVALVMSLLAACSGGGDASPATTATTPTVTATTEADPTTTVAPTTTEAPTTTIDPAEALAAAVEADLLEANRLENEASQDPFNADKEQAALERRAGFAAAALEEKLADYRQRNVAIRPNGQVPATVIVESPATLVVEGADVAQVQVCEINSWILVEVGAGPNGSDAVVNPDVVASRASVFLRAVDGVWKIEGGNSIAEWEGAASCPPE